MSELDEMLSEFDSLDENYQVKEVYAHFGAAMYYAQTIEQLLSNMIVFAKVSQERPQNQAEIDAIFDKYEPSKTNKRTLGRLISELKIFYNLDSEDETQLTRLLETRNFLTHDYFKLNIGFMTYKEGQKQIIKDFWGFKESVERMNDKLESKYASYLQRLNLTEEQIASFQSDIEQSCRNNAGTYSL